MLSKLITKIRTHFTRLKDPRTGKNISFSFADICMSGYSVFHMQCPSFLAHQERLKTKCGKDNGNTLFGLEKIPTENQIRNMLDTIETKDITPLFESMHEELNYDEFKTEEGIAVALDGTYFFSSTKISCDCCLKREHGDKIQYYHAMLCPALIHPEQKCALPLAPEFITNQDGPEKQDCELNAAKRWCESKREWLESNKVTLLGDDLFSRAPLIRQLMGYRNAHFVFVAKPTSHTYLEDWIGSYPADAYEPYKTIEKKGNKKHVYTYRIFSDVPLNGDAYAPRVNYFEILVVDEKGKQVYKNSFVTNHKISAHNIHRIAKIGRNRWRIENEAFNILKTKGYHLEHNFGHGQKNLANVLVCLNLIAFLVHHIAELFDQLYQKVRACFGARVRFFQSIVFVTSIQVFEHWESLLSFMASSFAREY